MMNQAQIKYARQRAEQIYVNKRRTVQQKFYVKPVQMSVIDKIEALQRGEFSIEPGQNIYRFEDSIKFNAIKNQPKVDEKGLNDALGHLEAQYHSLMDELMLGDQEEALNILRTFEVE